jgi:hypothetical protein
VREGVTQLIKPPALRGVSDWEQALVASSVRAPMDSSRGHIRRLGSLVHACPPTPDEFVPPQSRFIILYASLRTLEFNADH